MTGGDNSDPMSPDSLHYLQPRTGENVYTTAIRTVGDILQDYDYDKKILGLGFGSKVGGMVRHCHPLNDNPKDPYCRGVEGLLESYKTTLNNGEKENKCSFNTPCRVSSKKCYISSLVQQAIRAFLLGDLVSLLHRRSIDSSLVATSLLFFKAKYFSVSLGEPTCYNEVLEYAANDAIRAGSDVEYTVILLITDGGVTDFMQTKQVLVKLSSLPVSVVLVGVGHGDMTSLVQLDSDKARLCSGDTQASRDIVQFVGMKLFSSKLLRL